MTYIRPHSRPRDRRNTYLISSAVIVVVAVALLEWRLPYFLPAVVATVARPFWRISFSIDEGSLRSPESLLAENASLRIQLSDEETRFQTVGSVFSENEQLQSFFNRVSSQPAGSTTPFLSATTTGVVNPADGLFPLPKGSSSKTLAAVLKRPPAAPYDELILDIGADHGLSEGDKVYAPGNIPIGRIAVVLSHTSKAVLYSSPGESYDVLIGKSNASATADGRGSGQYEAKVPHDTAVAAGDFVIAPSIDEGPLGIVSAVIVDPVEPFKTVLFAPPVNIYQLRFVLVDAKAS